VNKILSDKHQTLDIVLLLLLTAGALLVHSYHPYAEDAEIYLPGVERILNQKLFPVGQEFFASHASLTFFPNLIAFSLRLTHLPLEWGLLLWHLASIFLLLLACWQLSGLLFPSAQARWGSVCLIAALLTIPVAGTALYIMDQYLNPRNLAAFSAMFAVTRTVQKQYPRAAVWLVLGASVHLLMTTFAFSFCALLALMAKIESRGAGKINAMGPMGTTGTLRMASGLFCLLPFGISLAPPSSQAYHQAALRHGFHYIQRWQWYEWLGILAPVILFCWFARVARARQWREVNRLCCALILYDLIYFTAALVVDLPARFESLARLQPLRSLHLLYMLMFVVMGGFLGEYVLKNRVWRWLALFLPLAAGMFLAQRDLFPESAHIELPEEAPQNDWAKAFLWIRANTSVDAVFALDPDYMHITGEDEIGFRCLAQRSSLADAGKDSGAVSMFPPLADEWWTQVQAQTPWKNFRAEDFARLKSKYGVSWVVVQRPGVAGIDCAYQNAAVCVCQLH
jgi:hypothetical protein